MSEEEKVLFIEDCVIRRDDWWVFDADWLRSLKTK